jgi:hypothetical protein
MNRSAAPPRKAVEISGSLHRDLTSYALAASVAGVAALSVAPPASAQIVYTPAHQMIGSGEKLFIDLNHDGIKDVMIREIPFINPCCFPSNSVQAVPAPSGGAIQLGNFYGGAAPLAAGALIGDGFRFDTSAVNMMNATDTYGYRYGSWADAPPSFLGIRFNIQGETHYGWARIDLKLDGYPTFVDVMLSGYAYETQPNVSIRAGDRGENDENAQGGDEKPPSRPVTPQSASSGSAATLGALARGFRLVSQPQ